jgi:3-dehydroquinate synthase
MPTVGLSREPLPSVQGAEVEPGARRRFQVEVASRSAYDVVYEPGLLARYGPLLVETLGRRMTVVLTDRRVHKLYGADLCASLSAAGVEPEVIVVPDGERSKSLRTLTTLLERLAAIGFDRRGVLVNFGGGVISDLGGFLAASYMRGVDYVNFGTSLIGQLDASVGGKVGVNAREAKNLVGAFHHPRHVAGDPRLLRTLSFRDFRSGIAEAIKIAIIASPDTFELLAGEREAILKREPVVLSRLIEVSARLKMDLVARDPYEKDLRRSLNFGHTIGHPIETEFGYRRIRHGEAVAVGMGVATMIARRLGRLPGETADRIMAMLAAYDLVWSAEPIRPDGVIHHMRYVRMIRGNRLHFVLPSAVGHVLITDELTDADLVRGFEDYAEAAAALRLS